MPAKTQTLSPAIAAQQAHWHAAQAAAHFADSSSRAKTATAKALARKRSLADAKLAMATLGLDTVCGYFRAQVGNGSEDQYRPILQELWNEQAVKAAGGELPSQPVAPGSRGALVNAQRLLTIALEQIEAALRVSNEQPGDVATIEMRRAG